MKRKLATIRFLWGGGGLGLGVTTESVGDGEPKLRRTPPPRSDLRQAIQIRFQHVALEDEVGEFAVALDLDQAGGLQFLNVVRKSRGADVLALADGAAGQPPGLRVADLLQDLIAAGFG